MDTDRSEAVGVILAGGGARGAYEAGALAALLPVLEQHGRRPQIYVGTSAGAINAALFASLAHLPADEAASQALHLWRSVGRAQVVRAILPSGLRAGLSYLGQLAGLQAELHGILDATPLHNTLDQLMDWAQIHRNIQDQALQAVAVVATASASGRSTVFVDQAPGTSLPPPDDDRAMDYVATALSTQHVMASAAIPVIFSPIHVDTPAAYAAWYLDGGLRLNAPIKPALALGAHRALIVATDPLQSPVPQDAAGEAEPDIYTAVADILRATLVDRMVEDVRTLGNINELINGNHELHSERRAQRGKRSYRKVPYLFVGPVMPGHLGRLAEAVFHERFGGLRWLRHSPDFPLLHRLFGGSVKMRGELLSYLFFDHLFIEEAIRMGQHDAQRMLAGGSGELPWQLSH